MAEVTISINGRSYDIACDAGQEGRIVDLAAYVDQRVQQLSRSGGAWNEGHLLVLAALTLADEIFEEREAARTRPARAAAAPAASGVDEQAVARLLGDLAKRINSIAAKVQDAA